MNKQSIITRWLWAAVLVACLGLVGLTASKQPAQPSFTSTPASEIGGAFRLTSHTGQTVTEELIQGKPSLMFFGFTMCPQVCPSTLADMTRWLKALGADADKINAVFVTVDPERDIPQQLAIYLKPFHKNIIGLTGTTQQIAAMTALYHIYSKKVPLDDGDYTVDHTGAVYLLDNNARFAGTVDYQEDDVLALAKIHRLLNANKKTTSSP